MPTKFPTTSATAQNDRLTSTKHVHRRDPNNPSTTWYFKDWVNDPGVSSSSLAARGLWMEMLAIAASAEPYGDVVINGRPISEVQLARRVGASVEEVTTLLAELEENGVFGRDRKDGRIFSRRMRKEAEISARNRANGAKGGNPALKKGSSAGNGASNQNHSENDQPLNLEDNLGSDQPLNSEDNGEVKAPMPDTHTLTPSYPSDTQKEEEGAREISDLKEGPTDQLLLRVIEAVGLAGRDLPRFWIGQPATDHVRAWITAHGLTEGEVVTEAAKSRTKNADPPDGPKALDRWMAQAGAAKQSAGTIKATKATDTPAKAPVSPEDRLQFFARWVKDTSQFMAPSTISNTLRDDLLISKMVTTEDLRARGIR